MYTSTKGEWNSLTHLCLEGYIAALVGKGKWE